VHQHITARSDAYCADTNTNANTNINTISIPYQCGVFQNITASEYQIINTQQINTASNSQINHHNITASSTHRR
jgi:hypothetical protein